MALSKLRDYVLGTDGAFVAPIATLESLGATRAMITTDDGVCQGYAHSDGRLWPGPLVTPTTAKANADAAATTQAATDATNLATFIARCTVLNNKAKAGTLTAAEIQESIAKLFRIAAALA
jgi:hypothetical protein